MTSSFQSLASYSRPCFGSLLLATLLILAGCDSGVAVDPLPADPAANMVGDPLTGAAQAKMATRTVAGDVTIEGTIKARRGKRARGLVRATGTTTDGTPFDLEGRARYLVANPDGAAPLFERAQLRLVGTVGTAAIQDTIPWDLRYREDDDAGNAVYDTRGRYRSDEQKGRLRGTLTGLFNGNLKSSFQFAGAFEFQLTSPPGQR